MFVGIYINEFHRGFCFLADMLAASSTCIQLSEQLHQFRTFIQLNMNFMQNYIKTVSRSCSFTKNIFPDFFTTTQPNVPGLKAGITVGILLALLVAGVILLMLLRR